jgi:enamine deaminase RidA (YjgF/YER057c/UK114 family)
VKILLFNQLQFVAPLKPQIIYSMKKLYLILIALLLVKSVCHAQSSEEQVTFKGNPKSPISSSVVVPAGKKYYFSSGSTAPVADSTATEGTRERYGDTKTQAVGILEKFKTSLAAEGLSLKDVIFMRVYIAPDTKTGKIDFQGWFDAYAKYFGTKENPTKPTRSTLGIAQLVNPEKLIEIELVAVF